MFDIGNPLRLLREDWPDATSLATELYSMLKAKADDAPPPRPPQPDGTPTSPSFPSRSDSALSPWSPRSRVPSRDDVMPTWNTPTFAQIPDPYRAPPVMDFNAAALPALPLAVADFIPEAMPTFPAFMPAPYLAPNAADQVVASPAQSFYPAALITGPDSIQPTMVPCYEVTDSTAYTAFHAPNCMAAMPVALGAMSTLAAPLPGLSFPQDLSIYDNSNLSPARPAVGDYDDPLTLSLPGGSDVFGVVTGGIGNNWTVDIYNDDFSETQSKTVYIPFIAATEQAPVGATIGPIMDTGYGLVCQVPVWYDSEGS